MPRLPMLLLIPTLAGLAQGSPGASLDSATRDSVIAGAISKLDEYYVFPETAKKMAAAVRERQKRGEYDSINDGMAFADLLTTHLRDISHDKHLRVNFSESGRPPVPFQQMQIANCGFEKPQ